MEFACQYGYGWQAQSGVTNLVVRIGTATDADIEVRRGGAYSKVLVKFPRTNWGRLNTTLDGANFSICTDDCTERCQKNEESSDIVASIAA